MARSLNKVQLIGNLTRDPELRYTPNGNAVCSFSLATNRNWTTDSGEKREEADFHRVVAWNKLAELCSQFLIKGRKIYVEGRLSTRNWTAQDGSSRSTTEVVISDMILLDSKFVDGSNQGQDDKAEDDNQAKSDEAIEEHGEKEEGKKKSVKKSDSKEGKKEPKNDEEVMPDDIPF